MSIPSVNGEHPERDLAVAIETELTAVGYQTELVGGQDRPSLGARMGEHPRVLLNGHTDTVPVDDAPHWRFDPFAGVVDSGAVHGRGACDMKGGLAVQVAVAQWLAVHGLADGLVLHFAMGEERGEPGTEDLIDAGFVAPMGVVLEPTDLHLGVAQRGMFTMRITIGGRAGHASRPELAHNPIDALPALLSVLEQLQKQATGTHRLLGSPQWTPTMIHSGVIPSMVPGSCEVHVDRRMIPGESVDEILTTVGSAISRGVLDADIEVSVAEEEGIYDAAEIDQTSTIVGYMTSAIESQGEAVRIFGTPYSSDIRHLINSAGIESVTYGPGRASEMHARNEHVQIVDLALAARVVALFCSRAITGG
ncbi:MAG: M20/M25/M40 family metallo-hydrolase [Acidimicrobiia bacterium]|nr:M20/M25/M40 family metallo-hydrolase [Acidimicrobiia bacterium]